MNKKRAVLENRLEIAKLLEEQRLCLVHTLNLAPSRTLHHLEPWHKFTPAPDITVSHHSPHRRDNQDTLRLARLRAIDDEIRVSAMLRADSL